ncbi:MAG: FAD-dependent oxidoreductase [Candidatus Jacksonbacteria bacterium]
MFHVTCSMIYDFAIIGGGAAGYTAAMYAGRLGLKTILFAPPENLLVTVEKVENYPGYKLISGFELFQKFKNHAKEYKFDEKAEQVVSVSKKTANNAGQITFILRTKKQEFKAKTALFATGSKYRRLPVPEAQKFEHKGVHYCALCDGFAYKNKIVAVVGGGDAAVKEALELAGQAKKVYLIARGERIKAELINQKQLEQNEKIEIILKTNVIQIIGDDHIEAVKLDRPYKNSQNLAVDGIFAAIGHQPNSALAQDLGVNLNQKKEIMIDRYSQTNIAGVYAAGDVVDSEFKQLITGCAEAVRAVYGAFGHITHNT